MVKKGEACVIEREDNGKKIGVHRVGEVGEVFVKLQCGRKVFKTTVRASEEGIKCWRCWKDSE